MREINVTQLSEEWFGCRLGKITASKFGDLIKTSKHRVEWTQAQTSILLTIAAERLTGQRVMTYPSKAMQWGIETEDEAVSFYELNSMTTVRQSGFFEFSRDVGGSPDGIIEGEGALEIKCPESKQHLKYLLDSNELIKMYKWQALGHIYNTGLGWCDLVSYDPRFVDDTKKMVSYRFTKEEYKEDLEILGNRLNDAVEIINGWL